jgi:squalene-hopene/tetraprenyl-beta-curcumene cyclase
MSQNKYSISPALTSFNHEQITPEVEVTKKGNAKVHHLPPSIWKKMTGESKSPLDNPLNVPEISFSANNCLTDTGGQNWNPTSPSRPSTSCCFTSSAWFDKVRERKMAKYILSKQTEEGFWTIWHNGPGDLSTTIEAYFCPETAGYSADHEP